MPMPVSLTPKYTLPPLRFMMRVTEPFWVYLMALVMKFCNNSSRYSRDTLTLPTPALTSRLNANFFSVACGSYSWRSFSASSVTLMSSDSSAMPRSARDSVLRSLTMRAKNMICLWASASESSNLSVMPRCIMSWTLESEASAMVMGVRSSWLITLMNSSRSSSRLLTRVMSRKMRT